MKTLVGGAAVVARDAAAEVLYTYPEGRDEFLDKVDRVRRDGCLADTGPVVKALIFMTKI